MSLGSGAHLVDAAGSPKPLPVSVVIPAHDRGDLIGRAVASVLAQHPWLPSEVIVVDDASSDDTGERAAEAGAHVIRHQRNRGEAAARNTGIDAATQPWIALLDSDDEWLSHHLATLWTLRDRHVLVADAMLACREDGAPDRYHGVVADHPVTIRSPDVMVFPQNFINPSATMFRRDAGLRAGGYAAYAHGTDLDFLLRLLEQGSGLAIPVVGGLYHIHAGQITQDIRPFEQGLRDTVQRYEGRSWWSPALVENMRVVHAWDDARRFLAAGSRARAASQLAWILGRPRRVATLVRMWIWRRGGRRRSGVVARNGRPTVVVLPGRSPAERATALAAANSVGEVVDLPTERGLVRAGWHLLRRPTSFAVVGSASERFLLRLLGIRAFQPGPEPSTKRGSQ